MREQPELVSDLKARTHLLAESALVGVLACCNIRNELPENESVTWKEEALHWMKKLARSNAASLREVAQDPVLRDLRDQALELASYAPWDFTEAKS